MPVGDFTASKSSDILIKAKKMFADSRELRQQQYPIDTIQELASRQKVTLVPQMDGNTCIGFKVIYLKACDETVVDRLTTAYPDCDIVGPEIESASVTYGKNYSKSKSFTVWDDQCADEFSEVEKTAHAMAQCEATLESDFNKSFISMLNANATANEHVDASIGTISGNATYIDGGWSSSLFSYFSISGQINRMYDTVLVSGVNLYSDDFLSRYKRDGCCDTDKIFRDGPFTLIFDLINLDAVVSDKATFMVDLGTFATWGINEFKNDAPMLKAKDTHVFRKKSSRLTFKNGSRQVPFYFDVIRKRDCKVDPTDGDTLKWGTTYDMSLKGAMDIGPLDCNDHTGILKFVDGPTP